jgi:hypothetical protein
MGHNSDTNFGASEVHFDKCLLSDAQSEKFGNPKYDCKDPKKTKPKTKTKNKKKPPKTECHEMAPNR